MFYLNNETNANKNISIMNINDYCPRKVPVVGITALGLDHTAILGNTLPAIAAAKAGIMKPGCVAFTVQQPPEAMEVLKSVAENVKVIWISA